MWFLVFEIWSLKILKIVWKMSKKILAQKMRMLWNGFPTNFWQFCDPLGAPAQAPDAFGLNLLSQLGVIGYQFTIFDNMNNYEQLDFVTLTRFIRDAIFIERVHFSSNTAHTAALFPKFNLYQENLCIRFRRF